MNVIIGVLPAGKHASAMPGFAVFAPAANIGDDENPAVFQPDRQPLAVTRRLTEAVTAVGVHDGRIVAIQVQSLFAGDEDWNLRAIG